jgi:hypothetical protein
MPIHTMDDMYGAYNLRLFLFLAQPPTAWHQSQSTTSVMPAHLTTGAEGKTYCNADSPLIAFE